MAVRRRGSGRYRQRVQIQTRTETRATDGGVTETWTALAPVWASVEPLIGEELWEAQKVNPIVTHRVRMRHRSDVTSKHRLVLLNV